MGEDRQFEVLLLRLVPYALRDDFMTVGVVVVEAKDSRRSLVVGRPEGEQSGFADVRFTRDWKRVGCFAPDFELEMLELAEATVRAGLKDVRGREDLLRLLEERFGSVFDVGPVKGLVAEDPVAEMRILERDHLEPMMVEERGRARARQAGRIAIVGKMREAFAEAGVLEMMQRDLEMKEFTGENDPFRVDFGFRVGNSLKMFHGLALNSSREPAVMLAYRYGRIREGMKARGDEALMTAVINEEAMGGIPRFENRETWGTRTRRVSGEVASGIAMLRASEIEVRGLGKLGEIAERVRRELGA